MPLDGGEAAVDRVRSKMSVRRASEAYSVPAVSLHDRLVKHNKATNEVLAPDMRAFRMTFSDEQQEDLVAYVKDRESRAMFVPVLGR
jgi:methionine-rich copper-binding protein CopC